MKIDNASIDEGTGRIVTVIGGHPFPHAQDCTILPPTLAGKYPDLNLQGCDCYISRVEITAVNGVPTPGHGPRWWERKGVIFASGYITCGLASFISRMFFGGAA